MLTVQGVGPAARIAAFHASGVGLRRIARAVELNQREVVLLALGYWLHDAALTHSADLNDTDDEHCMVVGCDAPRIDHKLCATHLSRFYSGRPLVGRQAAAEARPRTDVRVHECVVCGARWCALAPRNAVTCGDRRCVSSAAWTPERRLRSAATREAILARVHTGEIYSVIAADYGVTDRRISQLANRAGLFRREPRGPAQRAARARRRQD